MADAKQFEKETEALGKVLGAVSGLDDEGRQFVLRSAVDRLGFNNILETQKTQASPGQLAAGVNHDANTTPKQFLAEKSPTTDVERVTVLGYYLTHFRDTAHFKTADLTALNTEAAQKALSNTSVAVTNAQATLYITGAGKHGFKQVTAFGERIVEALPNREAVKAVMETQKGRGARRAKKKAAKKTSAK